MSLFEAAAWSASACWFWVTVAWILSLARRDAGVMDILWGPGFLFLGLAVWAGAGGASARGALLLFLVAVWGLRLAWHIARRSAGRPEDFRYRGWRAAAGEAFWWRSYFRVFLLQGAVMWVVAAPVVIVVSQPRQPPLGVLDVAGAAVWLAGFTLESVADAQLAAFRRRSNGRSLMTSGLWAWSRHPNYFGEAVLWWGVWLMASAAPGGVWTLFSPILITWLLRCVSGVPMVEAALERRPGWEAYAARTPPFLPHPPRRPEEAPEETGEAGEPR